jgi:ParB-like chromosome segregation protein Spo0J
MGTDQEFKYLVGLVRDYGLQEPILLDKDGLVIDGKRRMAACYVAAITPQFKVDPGICGPWDICYMKNICRKHLTEDQRDELLVKLEVLKAV